MVSKFVIKLILFQLRKTFDANDTILSKFKNVNFAMTECFYDNLLTLEAMNAFESITKT